MSKVSVIVNDSVEYKVPKGIINSIDAILYAICNGANSVHKHYCPYDVNGEKERRKCCKLQGVD